MFLLFDMRISAPGARFQAVLSCNLGALQNIFSHHHILVLLSRAMACLTSHIFFLIGFLSWIVSSGMARGTFAFVLFASNWGEGPFCHGGVSPNIDMFLIETLMASDTGFRARISRLLLDEERPFFRRSLLW